MEENTIIIDKTMIISDILDMYPQSADILMAVGMHCISCVAASGESLEEACYVHGLDPDTVVDELINGLAMVADEVPAEEAPAAE